MAGVGGCKHAWWGRCKHTWPGWVGASMHGGVGASIHGRGGWVGEWKRAQQPGINNDVDAIVLHALRVLVHGLLLDERGRHLTSYRASCSSANCCEVSPCSRESCVLTRLVIERHRLRICWVCCVGRPGAPSWTHQQRRRKLANQHANQRRPPSSACCRPCTLFGTGSDSCMVGACEEVSGARTKKVGSK